MPTKSKGRFCAATSGLALLGSGLAATGCQANFDGIYEVTAYTLETPCGSAPNAVPDAPPYVLVERGRGADEPDVYSCDDLSACEEPTGEVLHELSDGAGSTGVDGDVCVGSRTAAEWESTEGGIRVVATRSYLEIPKSEAGIAESEVWGWSSECFDALETHADSDFDCSEMWVLEATLLE